MAGTRWHLEVRFDSPRLVGQLKSAIGYAGPVAVTNDGPDTVVNFDYATEDEARAAQALAEQAVPRARCFVEALPLRDKRT